MEGWQGIIGTKELLEDFQVDKHIKVLQASVVGEDNPPFRLQKENLWLKYFQKVDVIMIPVIYILNKCKKLMP